MTQVNRCLIVPASYAPLARALCAGIASGESGEGMLTTPLSKTGQLPATHFISAGLIAEEFAALLPLTTYDADGVATTVAGQTSTIVELADGYVTQTKVTALLKAVNVTELDPFTAMGHLGLQIVQGDI